MILWSSLVLFAVIACVWPVLRLRRYSRERKGREELQRQEDSVRTIERLREAFSCDALTNLASDQSRQFS